MYKIYSPTTDCDQYLTGASGAAISYNWYGAVMLQNTDYVICIRREKGTKFAMYFIKENMSNNFAVIRLLWNTVYWSYKHHPTWI